MIRFKIDVIAFQNRKFKFHIFLAKAWYHTKVSMTFLMRKMCSTLIYITFFLLSSTCLKSQSQQWRKRNMSINLVLVFLLLTFTGYFPSRLWQIKRHLRRLRTYYELLLIIRMSSIISSDGLISNVAVAPSLQYFLYY